MGQSTVPQLRTGKFFQRPRRNRHLLVDMAIRKHEVYPFAWETEKSAPKITLSVYAIRVACKGVGYWGVFENTGCVTKANDAVAIV